MSKSLSKMTEAKPPCYTQGNPERIKEDFYNPDLCDDDIMTKESDFEKLPQPLSKLMKVIGSINEIRNETNDPQLRLKMDHILAVAGVKLGKDD